MPSLYSWFRVRLVPVTIDKVHLSRRLFLQMLAASASASPLFEEVPSSVSGLTWVHDNAMSPERYLPESLGPGVAFLDYDNDGWMDIYLVNSGPSDFFKPSKPLRNALYKNNRDGTFTDVTEKAGVAGGTFGMGVAIGDYNNDGFPDIFVTSYGARFSIATTATEHLPTSPKSPACQWMAGPPAPSGSTTITTESWTCSFAALWTSARRNI